MKAPAVSPALVWCAFAMVLAGAAAPGIEAQEQGSRSAPPTCAAEEHRQFDFWIGAWDVFDPDGRQIGMNVITMDLNGCVLHESWQSLTSLHRGHSYNIYDRTADGWHQTWVDNTGLLLQLDGELVDGRMVMEGVTRGPDGQETLNRITWTPRDDGTVQQLWEMSDDGGESWRVAFDGRYVRRE